MKKIERISLRDNDKCQYCGAPATTTSMCVDHVIPRNKGGSHDIENLKLACVTCNSTKGDRDLETFRLLKRIHNSPYMGLVSAPQLQRLTAVGAEFPDLPEHLFFFEASK